MRMPKLTDKMIESLELSEWKDEDERIVEELGIAGGILRKDIPLNVVVAAVHDALLYRMIYERESSC